MYPELELFDDQLELFDKAKSPLSFGNKTYRINEPVNDNWPDDDDQAQMDFDEIW